VSKKKLLFVMESLNIGGAEKSLLTILSMLDKDKYDVDLVLFRHTGIFFDLIPNYVRLIPEDQLFKIFDQNRKISPLKYLAKGLFKQAFSSLCYLLGALFSKMMNKSLYIGWKYQKYFFSPLESSYDVAIAFLERRTIYYVADFVNAKKKIGFIHNDYSIYPFDYKEDRRCFRTYNYIATVADQCRKSLCEVFPEYSEKFMVIKNMVSKDLIFKMAQEPIDNFVKEKGCLYLCSVGRLVAQKGFDRAIEVCNELVKIKVSFKWYIVGDGEEKESLIKKIDENHLIENLILVGADKNPYRWMKMCDVYVQPSRFEGDSVTILEARAMNKLMVVSNIPSFQEQLKSYPNVLLADEISDYAAKITDISHKEVILYDGENRKEIEKLYSIIDR